MFIFAIKLALILCPIRLLSEAQMTSTNLAIKSKQATQPHQQVTSAESVNSSVLTTPESDFASHYNQTKLRDGLVITFIIRTVDHFHFRDSQVKLLVPECQTNGMYSTKASAGNKKDNATACLCF
jgi:hypothetical protein